MTENEESEEKKEEKKEEKEEGKDKISSLNLSSLPAIFSDNTFLRINFFVTSAFLSLPEIPPDQA